MSAAPVLKRRCSECNAAHPLITTGKCIDCTYAAEKALAALRWAKRFTK